MLSLMTLIGEVFFLGMFAVREKFEKGGYRLFAGKGRSEAAPFLGISGGSFRGRSVRVGDFGETRVSGLVFIRDV